MALHRLIYWSLVLGCSLHAVWRGSAPERWAMGVVLVAAIVTPLLLAPMARRYDAIEWGGFASDLVFYAAFLLLAVAANRFWPLWVSAMQGVGTTTHFLGLFHLTRLNLTYALLSQIWIYPIMLAIVLGSERHRRRLARSGSDPSWKSSFAPSMPWRLAAGRRIS